MTALSSLDVSENSFSGPIPSFGSCGLQLTYLDLKSNALTGARPSSCRRTCAR